MLTQRDLRKKYFNFLIGSFISCVMILGCSKYINDPPPENGFLEGGNSELNPGCKHDPDSFKNFLSKIITPDLDCLQKNFHAFMKGVRPIKEGYLSKNDLKKVIAKFFEHSSAELIKSIDLLYYADYLLFGGDKEFISIGNVDKIFDFLIFFNIKYVRDIKPILDEGNVSYQRHLIDRKRVYVITVSIVEKLLKVFIKDREQMAEIDLLEVLELLENPDNPTFVEKMKAYLFVKRLFLGGDKNIINHLEFSDLLEIIPTLASSAFDLRRTLSIEFEEEEEYAEFEIQKQALDNAFKKIYNFPDGEVIFDVDEVIEAYKKLNLDFFDLEKYRREFIAVKVKILGRNTENPSDTDFFASDLETSKDLLIELLWRQSFYYKMYSFYQQLLGRPGPLRDSDIDTLEEYSTDNQQETLFKEDFIRIVSSYRFFKVEPLEILDENGEDKIMYAPLYNDGYVRSKTGVATLGNLEFMVENIFMAFGVPLDHFEDDEFPPEDDVRHPFVFTDYTAVNFFMTFKNYLKDSHSWKDDVQGLAENALLMGDLFQYQSNGDGVINVREAVEYYTTGNTGTILAGHIFRELKKEGSGYCDGEDDIDMYGRISKECVNKHFWSFLQSFHQFIPRLNMYLNREDTDKDRFLEKIQNFARDDRNIPWMNQRDILLTIGAMLNVESTILRFDALEGDNKLDNEELDLAFQVYISAIYGIINLNDPTTLPRGGRTLIWKNDAIARSAFYFLIDKESGPCGVLELISFHIFKNKTKIEGSRQSIAGILEFISFAKEDVGEDPKVVKRRCKERRNNSKI